MKFSCYSYHDIRSKYIIIFKIGKKTDMYEAEAVAKMEIKSQREEAELDMKTIEAPPKRRSSTRTSRAATLPPRYFW